MQTTEKFLITQQSTELLAEFQITLQTTELLAEFQINTNELCMELPITQQTTEEFLITQQSTELSADDTLLGNYELIGSLHLEFCR
jgi:hypothetical protein